MYLLLPNSGSFENGFKLINFSLAHSIYEIMFYFAVQFHKDCIFYFPNKFKLIFVVIVYILFLLFIVIIIFYIYIFSLLHPPQYTITFLYISLNGHVIIYTMDIFFVCFYVNTFLVIISYFVIFYIVYFLSGGSPPKI